MSGHHCHAGKPPPITPSSETSPPLLHQWSAIAASSPHVPQPPTPSSAPATHVNSPHTTRSHLSQPCSTPPPPEATTFALALIGKSTIASPLTACNNHRASLQFASSPHATTVAISSSTTTLSSLAHRTTTATRRQPALDNTIATSLQLIGVRELHLLRTSRCLNHHSRTSLTAIHCVDHAPSRAIVDIHRNRNKRDAERVLYRRTSGPKRNLRNAPCGNLHGSQTLIAGRELWLERETALTRGSLSLASQRVNIGQLWQRFGQQWSNRLFYPISGRWFLYRNPKLA